MAFQGFALVAAIIIGIGCAVYSVYSSQQQTPYTHGQRSYNDYSWQYQIPTNNDTRKTRPPRRSRPRAAVNTDLECTICCGTSNGPFSGLPCGHCFHGECIGTWLQKNKSCPNCRHAL